MPRTGETLGDARGERHPAGPAFGFSLALLALMLSIVTNRAPTDVRWARGIGNAGLGSGTYLNPIMPGDHPDPSILRTATTTT
jgi:xylan 1,4-beta-xylosidase